MEDLISGGTAGKDVNAPRKLVIRKRLDEIRKLQAENKKIKSELFKQLEDANTIYKNKVLLYIFNSLFSVVN